MRFEHPIHECLSDCRFLQTVGSWPAAREPEGSQSSVED